MTLVVFVALAAASGAVSAWLAPVSAESPATVQSRVSAPPPSNSSAETRNGSPDPTALLAALAGTAPLLADDRVETTLDPELTQRVHKALEIGRVSLGHVILMEPGTGRVLAWASTDPVRFPPTRTYPAASLIKVVTAAAALDRNPELLRRPCRYQGSPWRLNRQRIDPPLRGVESSFQKALAISNNQCFAQIAVNDLGAVALLGAIERFGWLEPPAPGYEAGSADAGDDRFDLGKLGCGLAGCRITPLHAVQMAGILADGWLREPRWIESMTDARGRLLALPPPRPARQVLTPELAKRMREMLVDTTARGTARSAFRDRRGRPILGSIQVAGKTGSLSGRDPDGRYEWFMGVAPADEPDVALAVVVVQGPRWWRSASQIAAEVLKQRFCPKTTCR